MKKQYYCEMESPIYRQIIAEKLKIEGNGSPSSSIQYRFEYSTGFNFYLEHDFTTGYKFDSQSQIVKILNAYSSTCQMKKSKLYCIQKFQI